MHTQFQQLINICCELWLISSKCKFCELRFQSSCKILRKNTKHGRRKLTPASFLTKNLDQFNILYNWRPHVIMSGTSLKIWTATFHQLLNYSHQKQSKSTEDGSILKSYYSCNCILALENLTIGSFCGKAPPKHFNQCNCYQQAHDAIAGTMFHLE